MLPFQSLVHINKALNTPVYIQISNELIKLITNGTVASGSKIPSSRIMAALLNVHRKTVMSAYDELIIQGWVVTKPGAGTFVNEDLPLQSPTPADGKSIGVGLVTNESYNPVRHLTYSFNDGHPDVRFAPVKSLVKEYASLSRDRFFHRHLNYMDEFTGDHQLKKELCKHLHETRGIKSTPNQLMITRGSIMAFYLLLTQYTDPGDKIVVGDPSYKTFNDIVELNKCKLIKVNVDESGLDVDALESICKRQPIKLVYVISHHHHPTTVKLSPERRIKLLNLSEKYGFTILEDDYDYDFHYDSAPILPLASLNHQGQVIYAGSFSKTMMPSVRLGFLVMKEEWVQELGKLRRYIDRTGDPLLERAMSVLLKDGEIRRSLLKALNAYRVRRNLLCQLLEQNFSDYIRFQRPEGGMAIWATFDAAIDMRSFVVRCAQNDLHVANPETYSRTHSTRLGFASMNEVEIEKAFEIFSKNLKQELLLS